METLGGQMKEFYIQSQGIRLHAKLDRPEGAGKGPVCILIHGFTGNMEEEHLIAAKDAMNDAGVSVLRVEMYGHGKSGGEFRDHTLNKWVENALSAVEYVKSLESATDLYLCGHSQGGLVAMLLGGIKNKDFKAIIPLSPAWMIPEDCRRGSILGTPFDPENIPEEVASGDGWVLSGDYIRDAMTIRVEDYIEKYRGRVLIIHGDRDETVPYSYGKKASRLYRSAAITPIAGGKHCFEDHLKELSEAIREFLLEEMDKTGDRNI